MNYFFSDVQFSPVDHAFLSSNATHIWLLKPEELDATTDLYQHLLSPAELARAQTFTRGQREFVVTRAFMRLCLARYTNHSANDLSIALTDAGKPYLTESSLQFNLSHCTNTIALAVGHHTLGIDVEIQRKRTFMEIAQRYFHRDEVRQLERSDLENQERLFFKFWTLKEAFFKALGGGIATGLDKVSFEFKQDQIDFRFAPELGQREPEWKFLQRMLDEKTWLSLACCQSTPLHIEWFNGHKLFHF